LLQLFNFRGPAPLLIGNISAPTGRSIEKPGTGLVVICSDDQRREQSPPKLFLFIGELSEQTMERRIASFAAFQVAAAYP